MSVTGSYTEDEPLCISSYVDAMDQMLGLNSPFHVNFGLRLQKSPKLSHIHARFHCNANEQS